ncbi:MAG: HEAT repeat domain-containing protein [Candidatus Auribacterota bacterium]|nr:HEAT repeat domain-containing protein [Candidatus Auribacterota bacterium]
MMKNRNNTHYYLLSIFLLSLFIFSSFLAGCGDKEERDVINYISDLGSTDYLDRMAAAQSLVDEAGKIDVIAVPYLIIALQDTRNEIRRSAAQSLGNIRDDSSIPALIAGLDQESDEVRYDCIVALGEFDDPRVHAPLLALVDDDSSYVRWATAESLGKLKVQKAFPDLIAGLKDSSSYVRSASAKALGKLGNKAAIPKLRSTIYNPNLWVRNAAALALSRLGDKDGVPILLMNLGSKARDKKGTVRGQAVEFLREISGKRFGFNPKAPPAKRKAAIKRWENWWEENK